MAQMAQAQPAVAMKAGNRTQFVVAQKVDPVFQAFTKWNKELVLSGPPPAGTEEPSADNKGYTVEGSSQLFCRPQLKVPFRGGLTPGPDVRFEQREDGLHLLVTFEEDVAKRPANAVPFDVRVKSVRLEYGTTAEDVLQFAAPILEPIPPVTPGLPAFKITGDALVPLEKRPGLVSAMKGEGSREPAWVVSMEFEWVKVTAAPTPTPSPKQPGGTVFTPPIRPQILIKTGVFSKAVLKDDAGAPADPGASADPERDAAIQRAEPMAMKMGMPATTLLARPDMLRAIIATRPPPPPPPQPTREKKTLAFERPLRGVYPNPRDPLHRPIFAAIDGINDGLGWRNTPHGWYAPAAVQDTVYCPPDRYLLEVDAVTGFPAISGVLMRKNDAGQLVDDLDPRQYKIRLTLRAKPDFDPERLNSLRNLIRSESSNEIKYSDLVVGGYKSARFLADESLAGLGELFAGATAGNQENINPEAGFALTYEGNGEFIDLIFQRLKTDGIRGYVELDLEDDRATIRKHKVPVELTLRKCAPVNLRLTMSAPPDADTTPNEFQLTNKTAVPVQVDGIQAAALEKHPLTFRVRETYTAKPEGGNVPFTLAADEAKPFRLLVDKPEAVFNSWDVAVLGSRPVLDQNRVLNHLFDAATAGVRGWKVDLECAPFAFFNQLKPEEQEAMRDVIGIEVEVRRSDSETAIEEVKLTREKPRGQVQLSRTLADFVQDRATGRSVFKYRQRLLRLSKAEQFGEWKEESGSSVTIYMA